MGERHAEVVGSICRLLREKYVFPDAGDRAIAHLTKRLDEGAYSFDSLELAETITNDLQAITKDAHLRVVHDPERIARTRNSMTGGRPDPTALAKAQNHGFACAKQLKGNIGYVDIRHFFPPSISGETAAAAMRFVSDCDAVIIDLRNNTGGNPSMVQFLCSYFVGGDEPVHLNTITSRSQESATEYWTIPDVPGKRMPDVDLFVLTSAHTFSGGEEFAYNMAVLNRGTIIGEQTAGGANPAGIEIISDSYYATIPHATPTNPITGSNWEGCGVTPHQDVPADGALEIAHTQALRRLIDNTRDELARTKLEWQLEEIINDYHPVDVPRATLERYVGKYGDTNVHLEGDTLIYQRRFFRYRLKPLSEGVFWLDGPAAGFESRVEFIEQNGEIAKLIGSFPDGRTIAKQR